MAFLMEVDPHENEAYRAYKATMELRRNRRQLSRWTGRWFRQSGEEVFRPWNLALGRYQWYLPFAEQQRQRLGTESYLINFLIRVDSEDRYANLRWYLERAERLDLNLQGVSLPDLRKATTKAGSARPDLKSLKLNYMTAWEINQAYWLDWGERVWWHVGPEHSVEDVWKVLKGRVPRERLVGDDD